MEKRRVVIIGLGCVTPLGHTVAETWQAVKDGVCGIGPITQYDAENQKVKLCAEVKDFDPTVWMDRREARHMARFAQLAAAAAGQAAGAPYYLTGGLCENAFVVERLGELLGSPVITSPQARFAGAIGAAVRAAALA